VAVRGEGGGGLGQLEAKARWGGRLVAGPRRRRRPERGGGAVGQPKAEAQAAGPKTGDGPKLKKKFFSNFN
jgi:hypothetical protein